MYQSYCVRRQSDSIWRNSEAITPKRVPYGCLHIWLGRGWWGRPRGAQSCPQRSTGGRGGGPPAEGTRDTSVRISIQISLHHMQDVYQTMQVVPHLCYLKASRSSVHETYEKRSSSLFSSNELRKKVVYTFNWAFRSCIIRYLTTKHRHPITEYHGSVID